MKSNIQGCQIIDLNAFCSGGLYLTKPKKLLETQVCILFFDAYCIKRFFSCPLSIEINNCLHPKTLFFLYTAWEKSTYSSLFLHSCVNNYFVIRKIGFLKSSLEFFRKNPLYSWTCFLKTGFILEKSNSIFCKFFEVFRKNSKIPTLTLDDCA